MRTLSLVTSLSLAAVAICATPPETRPTTENALQITYESVVSQNELFQKPGTVAIHSSRPMLDADPGADVTKQPDISADRTMPGEYMILMMDLSIPDSLTGKSPSQLVPGLGQNVTTLCHWLQTGLTQGNDGLFTSDDEPIAAYRKRIFHTP